MSGYSDIDGIADAYRDWCHGRRDFRKTKEANEWLAVEKIRAQLPLHLSYTRRRIQWLYERVRELVNDGYSTQDVRWRLNCHRAPRRSTIVDAILDYITSEER